MTYSSYAPANSDGKICATIPTASSLDSISIAGLEFSCAPSSIADMTHSTNSLLWQAYNGNNLWSGFNNLNAALKSMTIKSAELTAESSKASARSAYASAYGSLYSLEATAQLLRNGSDRATRRRAVGANARDQRGEDAQHGGLERERNGAYRDAERKHRVRYALRRRDVH